MSESNSSSSLRERGAPAPAHSDASLSTRPNTAASASTDPFASPHSSRAPSIHHQPPSPGSSRVSFPDSAIGFSPRRSILSQSGYGTPAFSSALSSATRLSGRIDHNASNTTNGSAAAPASAAAPKSKIPRMKSHMLTEGTEVPKPWTEKKNPRATFSYWIVYIIVLIGIAGGAVQCYLTYIRVPLDKQPLCIVLDESFDNEDAVFGENGTFFREVNMDGFGNGEFEMTTSSRNNSFISNGMLYIVPTLTADNIGTAAVFNGTVYNITDCTFNLTRPDNGFIIQDGERVFDWDSYYRSCSAVSNSTAGTVINPVQSARLTTRKSASIKYGRVEIRAKMPNGDWLWPAMWMLPTDEVYGPWPLSGEIDIVESRGNGLRYTAHGSNFVQGSLNWGPAPQLNGISKSYSWWTDKRKSFAADFHTYALEWTPDFIRIYVDTRLHTLLDLRFNQPFFKRGDFPDVVFNGSSLVALQNPWINGTNATPFDQDFYLILNVAVGSTNGWFPEGQGDKPWLDRAQSPPRDFAQSIAQWYPTWPTNAEDRALVVDYVKMWKHC
ncbi:ectomycorrhiza-upregulated GH16 glucan endo-1,3-beta-glucosidase precursor [Pholiota conissans]|uniref:Ectomycorrhiza-upregulated GH16 glucan endo-1,3-beta-glucosidase n=1 Tax=Pholiota conissans TaxID=109636 RepID=A0A9P5YSE3_9AGAR|nr:ectomycorrhiza-upregulated GH16 glucan endo-1,3-beta-glucosidase precursor [Pholiota conissans]